MALDLTPTNDLFSQSKVPLENTLHVGLKTVSVDAVIRTLEPMVTSERMEKLKNVVARRHPNVVTVLENIFDRGNVSAVMRTAEALGFYRFSIVEPPKARFKAANRVTKGAEKWLDVQVYSNVRAALDPLKAQGYQIVGTDLNATQDVSEIAWDIPTAFVIGNEKDGISEEMKAYVDRRVKLPMVGFSQSFNLSVAAGMILYQAFQKGSPAPNKQQYEQIYASYLLKCFDNPERFNFE